MAKPGPSCAPSSSNSDSNVDESSLETLITDAWDRAEGVLQRLKDSQGELLNRVQKLKEDWQGDMDSLVNSCEQEIEGLNNVHNADVERLRIELQSRALVLKDQLNSLQQNWQLEVGQLTNISPALPGKR
ncbi:hypothetical protein KC19_3G077200 [Ceratodon purpureus]|uniref:Uncharacterized protein n=1 Tax=Ceratodon purpureus TaxID=3225 RepID=A0A8T0IJR0_CERPU|nr:hypothetical protein KC19_3G077200 [Ceratodon purpureus]